MKKTILITIFLFAIRPIMAQVNLHINYDDIRSNPSEQGFPWDRYYYGDFSIERSPEPLVPTEVNFTLVAMRPDGRSKPVSEDWVLKIIHNNNATRILGDTLLIWPGPHKPGDSYTGSFQFVPLLSGKWDVGISRIINSDDPVSSISDYTSPIAFSYCLDEDGQLCYLDRSDKMRSHCTQMNVIFFDSIDINATYIASRPHEIFDYTFKITPLPHIGDTSILSMKLQAIDSLPNGCDILFKGYCMEFLTGPEPIYDKVDIGDVFDMKIRFVPAPVRDGHRIVFILSDIDRANIRNGSYQLIPLKLIFDNDGTLRYVSQSGFPGLTDDRLPDAFPPEENKGDLTKTLKLYRKH